MTAFAFAATQLGRTASGALHGLKLVAVAVVAQAVWGMSRSLAPDRDRATLAIAACLICLAAPSSGGQIAAILLGAAVGVVLLPREAAVALPMTALDIGIPRGVAMTLIVTFFILLFGLPWLADAANQHWLRLVTALYRDSSLVFGGGHVVLPLLQDSVVAPGWVRQDIFLAGYGATQAMPGPIFTFAAFLGAVETPGPSGWLGASLATVAIFGSSFLLVGGLLPFWETLRRWPNVRAALRGVNAAVVGVLLAALFNPIWLGSVHGSADFGVGLLAFLMLMFWAIPPWMVVAFGAAAGWNMALMGL
jgi:chromate transporter